MNTRQIKRKRKVSSDYEQEFLQKEESGEFHQSEESGESVDDHGESEEESMVESEDSEEESTGDQEDSENGENEDGESEQSADETKRTKIGEKSSRNSQIMTQNHLVRPRRLSRVNPATTNNTPDTLNSEENQSEPSTVAKEKLLRILRVFLQTFCMKKMNIDTITILKQAVLKANKAKASPPKNKSSLNTALDNLETSDNLVFLVEKVNERYCCVVAGCAKSFLNVNGMAYHMKNHQHDVQSAVKWMNDHLSQIEPEHRDIIDLSQVESLIDAVELPFAVDGLEYWFPGSLKATQNPVLFGVRPPAEAPTRTIYRNYTEFSASRPTTRPETLVKLTPNYSHHVRVISKSSSQDPQIQDDFLGFKNVKSSQYMPLDTEPIKIEIEFKKQSDSLTLDVFKGKAIETGGKYILLNTGLSVWAMDWALDVTDRQYLAVGGYRNKNDTHSTRTMQDASTESMQNIIQIWKFDNLSLPLDSLGEIEPCICIAHEYGRVYDLCWLPIKTQDKDRLGLLACAFGDGSVRLFDVPQFNYFNVNVLSKSSILLQLIKVSIEPLLTVQLNGTGAFRISCSLTGVLAVGYNNGALGVYNLIKEKTETLRTGFVKPVSVTMPHASSITSMHWYSDTMLVTSSRDGRILAHDINYPMFPLQIYQIRGIVTSCVTISEIDAVALNDLDQSVRLIYLENNFGDRDTDEVFKKFKTSTITVHASCISPFLSVYKTEWNSQSSTLKMTQINVLQEPSKVKMNDFLFEAEESMQKCVFSKKASESYWIASGGSSGIVRLDSIESLLD